MQAAVSTSDPPLPLNSMANLRNGNFFTSSLKLKPGYGEDDELSVAGILWALANDNTYSQFCSGPQQLFQILSQKKITTLSTLWGVLTPQAGANPQASQNAELLGRLFKSERVSPRIDPERSVDAANQTISFLVPTLHSGNGFTFVPTLNTVSVLVFDASWKEIWSFNGVSLETPNPDGPLVLNVPNSPLPSGNLSYTLDLKQSDCARLGKGYRTLLSRRHRRARFRSGRRICRARGGADRLVLESGRENVRGTGFSYGLLR